VDGRTLTKHWKEDTAHVFEDTAATIESDGWIVGRKTMQEFASKKPRRKRKGRFKVPKGDFVAEHTQKTYAVAIDPSGKLNWEKNHVDTEHVIAVLKQSVPAEYLHYLRERNVSYIIGGKTSLDLKLVVRKLHDLFGVRRITVQGGGTNNGSFLNTGLIDEVSVIVMPFADGEVGTQSVFDIDPRNKRKTSHRLKLVSMEKYRERFVWLRYKVE
jgi:riboflavin biosynthesis pyrimidine reductase